MSLQPSAGPALRLTVIRSVHSAVFLLELSAMGWLVITGLVGRRDRSVAIASALVAIEAGVFRGQPWRVSADLSG